MHEIYYYISQYIDCKLYGRELNTKYEQKALDAVSDAILINLQQINENLDISVTLLYSHVSRSFVLDKITIAIETFANKIIIDKNKVVTYKGKITNEQLYIDSVYNTIAEINNQVEQYYKQFEDSGELILLNTNLYLHFYEYVKWYNLRAEELFVICENIIKKHINECLFAFNTIAAYNMPALLSYYCPLDELPPIQFDTLDNLPVKTYCVSSSPDTYETEFALTCFGADRNKLYFITMIVNIFEAAKAAYLRKIIK